MPTIKLTNSVLIDSSTLQCGIDVTNVIVSTSNANAWTATQDCIVFLKTSGSSFPCTIDDVATNGAAIIFIVKKGTKCKPTGTTTAYGLK